MTDPATLRHELRAWLDAHDLSPAQEAGGSLEAQMAQYFRVRQELWAAGFARHGWPEHVGGLGGPPLLRAVLGEEVAWRQLVDPTCWSMIEVLAPTVVAVAGPERAASLVGPFLRGEEMWCQGFSEPGAGSDLASLACRAVAVDGGGWRVDGQKVWTSFAQHSRRCVLLARTGDPVGRHRGITAFLVDLDTPGITVRPIETQHGRPEFAEVFFDGVLVPADRVLGVVGGGWQVAMDILPYERSTTFWHRGVHLHARCDELVSRVASQGEWSARAAGALGEAYQALLAFRFWSRDTQHRLAAGEQLGAETSIDKILIATAEQQLFDTARDLLEGEIELGTGDGARRWREELLYAKAATIYGGTAEIQRNIVARRLLDLGPEP